MVIIQNNSKVLETKNKINKSYYYYVANLINEY
jgi:hypothetical protein